MVFLIPSFYLNIYIMTIIPAEVKTGVLHSLMLAAIAPRPIALVSTINEVGFSNLSPFSFFNAFGSNPPILVFSPARRVRDNTIKHTLKNVKATKEVVIGVVNQKIVNQISLSSCEYPENTSEFIKAGLTPIKAHCVKPFLIKESPVNFECKVLNIIETGQSGGAGNLVVCEILRMHIAEEILDNNNKIDQSKIDLVGRLGADYYCTTSGTELFEVAKPNLKLGIGFDLLPEKILNSEVLTGSDLAFLANVEAIPIPNPQIQSQLLNFKTISQLHNYAKQCIKSRDLDLAWQILLKEI
jgi:flavin reductase (DIM6/NTAB) family NADH-FMN oxidoreductase RutF